MKLKYKNSFYTILAGLLTLTGCVKENTATFTDFSSTGEHVILQGSGLANFKATNLRVDNTSTKPDSIQILAGLSSANTSTSDIAVTLAADNNLVTTYNAANGTNFKPFPVESYKLLNSTVTIAAGSHYASTYVVLDQTKFDPTISYMLPISIKDAGGKPLTSNLNTLYYNIIGNPIAGNYKWDFTRWSSPSNAGSPDANTFTNHTATLVADDPTTVEVKSGYFIGPRYVISFTNTNGTLSNFKVSFNDADAKALVDGGVTVTDGPNIIKADPVKGEYIFQYATLTRYVIDRYYK